MNYEDVAVLPKHEKITCRPSDNVDIVLQSQKKKRPDEIAFIDEALEGYRKQDIEKDLQEIARLQKRSEAEDGLLTEKSRIRKNEGRKRSEAMEIILTEKGEEMGWYGENSSLDRTGLHDDWRNGIDWVWTISVPGENTHRIALAIDVSMRASLNEDAKKSGKVNSIREKIERNISKVTDPRQRIEVKYFKSSAPTDNYKGKLTGIVPVVVGVEGENALKLINLFGEIASLQKNEKRTAIEENMLQQKIQEARNHPCQALFLREIRDQLEMYSDILKREGSIKGKLFKIEVEKLFPVIDNIINLKKDIPYDVLKQDKVFTVIQEVVREKRK